MNTHDGFPTAGPSAVALSLRSMSSRGFPGISASARRYVGLAMLLAVGFLWACEQGQRITAIDSLKQTFTLTLSTPENRVYEGQMRQLKLTVRQGGTVVNPNTVGLTISWRSEDPAIASVDAKGLLKGIAEGKTQIVASSSQGREVSASVTVTPGAQSIEVLNADSLAGVVGEVLEGGIRLQVKGRKGGDIEGITVRFEVLSGGGTVEPTELITDSGGWAEVQWTLGPAAGDQELDIVAQFAASVPLSAAGGADPSQASSAPGKGVGRGVKALAKAAAPKTVTIVPASAQLLTDGELQFQASVEDKFGNQVTNAALVWSASDPSIVTVSDAGMAYALALGSAEVVASVVGKSVSGSAQVDVVGILGDLTIHTTSMLAGTVGTPYSQTLAATGGDGGYVWTLFNGTTLPASLSLNAGTGVISGTPTASGLTDFEVEVTSVGNTDTRVLSININSAGQVWQVTDLAVLATASNSVTLGFTEVDGGTGSPASYDIRYATPPLSWGGATVVTQGTCASPLSGVGIGASLTCLVDGLNGATSYDFQLISFRGTLNVNAVFGERSNVVTASTTAGPPAPPSITTSSPMPNGVVGVAYSKTLAASGGDATYAWALFNGTTLPAGLGLNAGAGEISGTPTAAGTTNFEVEVTSAGETATRALQITIDVPPPPGSLEITDLSRDVGSSSGGTVLEITGTAFEVGAVASFGGVDASSTVFNSVSSLTVTVPPHAAGLIDVTVTNPSTQSSTLTNGFEYLPAPTVTYITHDFENPTDDFDYGPFTSDFADPRVRDWTIPGTESETYGHPFPLSVSGNFSVRARKGATSDGASKLVHRRSGLTPTNPPLEPTGVYQRWYQYIPGQSLDMAANAHAQIKFLLNRGGPGGWLMGILGAQASGTYKDEVVMQMDFCNTFLPPSTGFVVKSISSRTGFRHPPDTWVEFQTWFFHDGTNGRARLWINGKEMFDVTDACLGTSDATGAFDWETGIAWVQGNTTGLPTFVYVDDAVMANGYVNR